MLSVKNIFLKNEKKFDSIINTLTNTINNSYLKNEVNIFSQASVNEPFGNLITDQPFINFLTDHNFIEIHIYSKAVCDNSKMEHQTYVFETQEGILLQYDKCIKLSPNIPSDHFENSSAVFEKINKNWVVIFEKF